MVRRYLFLCPDTQTASGGIAVIYDTVAALCRAGYDAAILHNSPAAGYLDHPDKPPRYYTYDYYIARQRLGLDGKRARLMSPFMLLGQRFRGGPLEPLRPGADDILVIPEFMITAAMTAFPGSRLGVFVQNPFAFQEAHAEAMEKGLDIRERAEWFLGVSKICLDQFDLLNIETGYHLPVSMKPEDFPFREEKERLITYMPRKRSAEARQIVDVLERRGRLKGYRIEEIDNMPRLDVSDYLQRSQFFISLLRMESIGFPAAEAMAAGCIVVGYTGLGGREYFTPETGIPVTEDDTLGLVHALEATVAEYATAPARLDAIRRHASEVVNASYNSATFEAALLRIWRDLDAR
ncbi:glycosyltransferase [Paracoccus sp. TD-10]|uniref:glycosyltransferase n=1 Tax=Paracoccus sp. TD-10 TaxID=3395918 RepID=UPI003AAFD842